ncbi:siderophore-interacting protein [Salana multivorans]
MTVLREAVVASRTSLTPSMVRIRLAAERGWFTTTGVPDEYVRLHLPTPRTYTVRQVGPDWIDVDFVLHGHGVAGRWAATAEPGETVGVGEPGSIYDRPTGLRRQLLLTDATGLPAVARICEETPAEVSTVVVAGFPLAADAQELLAPGPLTVRWLPGVGNGLTPSRLAGELRRALAAEPDPDQVYVWAAGETREVREVRRLLRHELHRRPTSYKVLGYWTDRAEEWRERYLALPEETRRLIDELYDSDLDTEEVTDRVDALYDEAGL